MNWNDTVTIAGQPYMLKPEAGALMQLADGTWRRIREIDGKDCQHEMLKWAHGEWEATSETRPILPAVPAGCTREQVLEACLGDEVDLGGGYWAARDDEGDWCMERRDTPKQFWWDFDLPALKLAIQRYEALLAWWAANEAKHGD